MTFTENNKKIAWMYCVLIIASAVAAFLAVKNIIISSDSISYGLVSQQIIAGNGIRIPLIRFDNVMPVNGTVPFAVQAPLVPVLLALLGGITPQSFFVAQILNMVFHVSIALFTFLLMKKYCINWVALLTGVLVAFSYPMLWNTHHLISETAFIAFTVAVLYFINLSRHDHDRSGRYLAIAGICASAAILSRYAGIALLAVFLWEVLRLIRNRKPGIKYGPVILATTLPVITISAIFARNYILLGTIRGVNLPAPDRSLTEAVAGTIKMLFLQFQLGRDSSLLVIIFMVLLLLFIASNANRRREALTYFHSGLDSIIIYIIGYTAMICITMAKDQPVLEVRYISPLAPFLLIVGIFIIVFTWKSVESRKFSRLPLYGMMLSLGLVFFGIFYKSYLTLPGFMYKQEKIYSILDSCTYKWVRANYGKNTVIATNNPYRLSFFGGYSTIMMPNRKYITNAAIPEDMGNALPDRMSEVGAQVLSLFDEVKEEQFGKYLAGLSNNRGTDDKFTLVHECPDGVVYKLKE